MIYFLLWLLAVLLIACGIVVIIRGDIIWGGILIALGLLVPVGARLIDK